MLIELIATVLAKGAMLLAVIRPRGMRETQSMRDLPREATRAVLTALDFCAIIALGLLDTG